MADTSQIKKTKGDGVSWKNKPYATNPGAEEKRKQGERWHALNEFVRRSGGAVTSPPGKTLQVEVPKGSPLPAKLVELGYNVAERGTVTRIVGADSVRRSDEKFLGTPSPFAEYSVFEIRTDGR